MAGVKRIEAILSGSEPFKVIDMEVKNYLPILSDHQRMSPFFMLDHGPLKRFSPISGEGRVDGLHPHRGLETVTVVYEGAITHYDTKGNGGTIHKDEAQWMTAGAGIQHTEFPELPEGGLSEMIQLWVLLPRAHKMTEPKYQPLTRETIKSVPVRDGEVRIIAGNYSGVTGPATSFTPIHLLDVRLEMDGEAELTFPAHFNTGVFVVKGAVEVNGETAVASGNFILFENAGEDLMLKSLSDRTVLLILSGQPLQEPIAHRGPFVMNIPEELDEAYQDFWGGKFG
ncbi:pirin family protein [Planococcus shenhongbingii]|uniref:pirin family protein n=1 Tax=Planococcus shenhongbingii TaxID=3058398 RepID=UPI002630AAB1|nr:pirin family protein [Planococcus sp. N016]WKA58041.1 pirin family protein [Planococcus sp. N016]